MLEELREMVLEIVGEIPYGNVVSYKQLATLAGYPKHARLIGKIMSTAPYGYPCHRVLLLWVCPLHFPHERGIYRVLYKLCAGFRHFLGIHGFERLCAGSFRQCR